MSCSNYKSTINIASNKINNQKCSADCAFTYKHNKNSSCKVINKEKYLEIITDGTNDVKFNNEPKSITSIRLYQPSIHLFDGSQADAEFIIQYGGGGENLFVCMPIKVGDGQGKTNLFFSKFIPYINSSEKNTTQIIQTSSWSLDDVLNYNIPYYYYLGSFLYEPCNGNASVIVFDIKNAAKINTEDLNSIKSYISKTPKAKIGVGGYLMYNEKGPIDPNNPNNNDDYDLVSCVEVNGLPSDAQSSTKPQTESIFKKIGTGGADSYGAIFLYVILGLIVISLLIFFVFPQIGPLFRGAKGFMKDNFQGTSINAAPKPSSKHK